MYRRAAEDSLAEREYNSKNGSKTRKAATLRKFIALRLASSSSSWSYVVIGWRIHGEVRDWEAAFNATQWELDGKLSMNLFMIYRTYS
jgi:hypothetical protein